MTMIVHVEECYERNTQVNRHHRSLLYFLAPLVQVNNNKNATLLCSPIRTFCSGNMQTTIFIIETRMLEPTLE